jgi:DMSO/TMAO reductase YedYZ heme-binding membrane subunit
MNPQVWWYVARASGIVAWLLLTASVMWGILLAGDAFRTTRRPAWLLDLHRWLGGLTVAFVAAHLAALVADDYVHLGVAALTIPMASPWRPGAVALGVVALWTLLAVELTSLARRHLPRRVWRSIHLASYLTFALSSLHATFAGTDSSNRLYVATTTAATVAVVWAAVHRLTSRRPRPPASTTRPSTTGA